MANPSSSSPVRGGKSDRNRGTSTDPQNAPPQQTPHTGSAPAGASSVSPSWQTGSAASSPATASGTTQSSGGDGIAQKFRDQANARLSSQKDRVLEGVGGVTEAIRQTTQSLRDRQHDTVARYVEQVASQVDRVTQTLRQKDVGELLDDAQRLARRQPALFVGSAFAIGLLGARFLKSSPPEHGYTRDYGPSRGYTGTGWRTDESARGEAFRENPASSRE
jgi:hypothetical protein